jgi:hypothetical protein
MPSAVEILFVVGGIRDVQAAIGSIGASLDKLAKTGQTAAERSAKARVRTEQDAAKSIERASRDAARAKERAAKDELRVKNQINALEVRDWQKTEREKTRAAESAARDRERIAKKEATDAIREQERAARHRAAQARTFGSTIGGAANRTMGIAGRLAMTVGAVGGGFAIADTLGKGIREEAMAGQIVRSSAVTGGLTGKNVEQASLAAAIGSGGIKEQGLAGIDAFIRETGDLKSGVELVRDLARYAAASGASMENLGAVAGQTFTHMNGDVGKTKEVLLALSGQAKTGAIDIRNLAEYGGRLVGSAELFQGGTGANIETFGALAQLAKRKGGKIDAAEATEAASRIFGEVSMHAQHFEGMGVKVKGAGGKLRPVEDILLDTLVKTKGDITAIPKLFGRQAGGVEVGLAQSFLEGSGGKTDAASLAAGRARAAAAIQELRKPSTEADVDEGVKARLAENEAKINIAMEQFHNTLNERLLPKLPELIDKFVQLIPAIEKFIDAIVAHPYATIIGGTFAAEIAKAGLASIISKFFTGAFGVIAPAFTAGTGAAVSAPAAAAAGATGGAAAAGGVGVLGALGAAGAGVAAISAPILAMLYGGHKLQERAGESKAATLLASAENTPEEKRAKLEEAQKMVARAQATKEALSHYGPGTNTDKLSPAQAGVLADAQAQGFAKQLQGLTETVSRLKTELNTKADQISSISVPTSLDNPNNPNRGGIQ